MRLAGMVLLVAAGGLQVLPGARAAEFQLPAMEGKEWRPMQLHYNDQGIQVSFCLVDYDNYQSEPWKYPMDGALLKASNCRQNNPKTFTLAEIQAYMDSAKDGSGAYGTFLEPTGLIHHETRCGSTLMSNMIAHVPSAIMVTESLIPYNIIGAKSAWGRGMSEAQQFEVIRTVMRTMCHTSHGRSSCFLKLPSAFHLDVFVDAFPQTPWVFLFRAPHEVLASQLGGQWSKHDVFYQKGADGTLRKVGEPPRKPCLQWAIDYGSARTPEDRCVHALSWLCAEALTALRRSDKGLAVDYSAMPGVVWEHIWGEHFGLGPEAVARDTVFLREASLVYSKANGQPSRDPRAFSAHGDGAFKESQLTPEALTAVDGSSMPGQYQELCALQRWPAVRVAER